MPWLTYPLAALGLAAVPVLAAIYLLRNRFRRRPVSSLLLWRNVARPREGGVRVRRMAVPPAFFLELLILLLLTAAALDPRWPLARNRFPLIVVLDDSASMRAEGPDGSPRQRAERALRAIAEDRQIESVRLIVAGREPDVLPAVSGRGAWRQGLARWTCAAPDAALGRAVAAACEIGRKRGRVLVVTDRAPGCEVANRQIRWLAFGRALPNTAIVGAARSPGESRDRCLVQVAAFTAEPVAATLRVRRGSDAVEERTLRLQPDRVETVDLNLAAGAGAVEIALGGDALEVDNRVTLLPQARAAARVRLDLDEPLRSLVRRALAATGKADAAETQPDLLVTDKPLPAALPADAWALQFVRGGSPQAYAGPFVVDRRHPLTRGLQLDGVLWGTGATNAMPGAPVVMVGSIPLLFDETLRGGRHALRMAFAEGASTLQQSPSWPALFWNLMDWRIREAPGPADANIRLGVEAVLRVPAGAARVSARTPGGDTIELAARGGRVLVPTAAAGVYEVDAGSETYRFACNFLAPAESDLSGCAAGAWGQWVDAAGLRRDYDGTAWAFALLALCGLGAHAWLVTAGAGRRSANRAE